MDHARLLRRFVVMCVAALFSLSSQAGADQRQIRIGVMSCLSGDCAEWGSNSRRGVELAIAEINQRGGILGRGVTAAFEDSRDDIPSRTVSAYRRLAADKEIHFMVGPTWTIGGMSIAPLIAANKDILVVSPSVGVKEFNETADNIFNTWPHDEKGTRALARFAFKQGRRSAAILGSQDPWVKTQSDTFAQEFGSLGGIVKTRVEPLPASRDLRSEALKIKGSAPDVVFLSNYQVDVIAKEFAALNYAPPKLAILMEKDRVKAAHGALEGTVFALYEKPSSTFSKAFIDKFKVEPGITADTAYDAVMILALAIEGANSFDVGKVKSAMRGIKDFKGASGTFSVDSHGAVDKAPVLWTVNGDDYIQVQNTN